MGTTSPAAYTRIDPSRRQVDPGPALRTGIGLVSLLGPITILFALLATGVPLWVVIVVTLPLSGAVTMLPERLWPYQDVPRRVARDYLDEYFHLVVYDVGVAFLGGGVLLWSAGRLLGAGIGLDLWPAAWPVWGQVLLAFVVLDFLGYWRHRIEHESGDNVLWHLHSVHHSIEFLDTLRATRVHPLENFLVHGPGCFVVGLLGGGLWTSLGGIVCVSLMAAFQHQNVDIRLGPFNYVFVGPEGHRWHHHQVEAQAKNYADVFALWDVMFGTFNVPRPFDGRVGLASLPRFPRSRWEQALLVVPRAWRRLCASQPAAAAR
jgi:sterol desaturase/sphingolipid hydroxylase (fatty acid hydroxylase superfamily)